MYRIPGQAAVFVLAQSFVLAQNFVYAQSFVYTQSFGGQSLSSRPTFWHRNRPALCKRPVPKLQKAALFAIERRSFMEGSCIGFWKSKANSTFCKVVKQKGEAFWQPLQPWFVKETAFFFAKAQNSGIRLVPDSGTGCRFYAQSFVYAQSFAFAVFATLVCQRNCVFLCKGTKQRIPGCTGFRDRLPFLYTELCLCTELCFGTVNLHNMPELYSRKINKRIKYWRKFFL